MALPVNHPFNNIIVSGTTTDVTNGKTAAMRAPCRGKIVKISATLGAASATADATATTSIAGTAVTNGVLTLTQASSAAGTTFTVVPSGANTCNEDDAITIAQTGSGTAGGFVTYQVEIRPA
jgi:hypothetical protein